MAWYTNKRATTVIQDSQNYTACFYHQTSVCRWNRDEIILDSGGFRTNTTKTRMNQCSKEYGLGFRVDQVNHEWVVTLECGGTIPFSDGLVIYR